METQGLSESQIPGELHPQPMDATGNRARGLSLDVGEEVAMSVKKAKTSTGVLSEAVQKTLQPDAGWQHVVASKSPDTTAEDELPDFDEKHNLVELAEVKSELERQLS